MEGFDLLTSLDRAQLPAHYERLLIARHFQGCTLAELAKEMGLAQNAIKQLCVSAEQQLLHPRKISSTRSQPSSGKPGAGLRSISFGGGTLP